MLDNQTIIIQNAKMTGGNFTNDRKEDATDGPWESEPLGVET